MFKYNLRKKKRQTCDKRYDKLFQIAKFLKISTNMTKHHHLSPWQIKYRLLYVFIIIYHQDILLYLKIYPIKLCHTLIFVKIISFARLKNENFQI